MDIKKTQKAIEKNVATRGATIAGVVVGMVLGRAGYGLTEDLLITAGGKNNKMINLGKRVAIAGVALVSGSAIEGNDTMSEVAKGVSYGIAGIQVADAIKEAMADNPTVIKLTTGSKLAKAAAKGLGLGCPCNEMAPQITSLNAWTGGRRRFPITIPESPFGNGQTPPVIGHNQSFFTMEMAS